MGSELPDIPHDLQRLYRRFERWRSAHTGRLPIPERLRTATAELAREYCHLHSVPNPCGNHSEINPITIPTTGQN